MPHELHLELLLGKRLRDVEGKPVGRIEEFRAELKAGEWIISEYLVGSYGLWERLSAWSIVRLLLGRRRTGANGSRIPWDQMDLADPNQPRLRCRRETLTPIQ